MRWGANAKFSQIINKITDYVIGVKGNQGKLREAVELFFDEHLERDIGGDFVKQSEILGTDHGRIETHRYTVCSDIEWLRVRHDWPGLKTVIMTEYTHEIRGKCETIRRFHILSFADSPEKMARCIRDHWQVEIVCIGFWTPPSDETIAASEKRMRRPISQRSIKPH